jgi:Tfp pilus assembly protein PilF
LWIIAMPIQKPKRSAQKPNDLWKRVLMALLIGAATAVLFWPGTKCDFVNLDDDLYVYANPHVQAGLSLEGLRYAFTSTEGGSWMPLTWLSYLLDASLWGNKAAGFHTNNILLHAGCASLLFVMLLMTTREFWPSALAAALFAAHPLRLESVIWIAERKDVLSGLFGVLTLIAYARYVTRPGKARMSLVVVSFGLSLMAKPMLVTLPALLLLLDVWLLRRCEMDWKTLRTHGLPLLKEKIPLIVLSLVFAVITFATQKATGAVVARSSDGWWQWLRIADNYGFYLGKIFWPVNLNILYPTPALSLGSAVVALLLVVAVSFVAWRWARSCGWFAMGWLWFLIALIPVIGIVPIGSTWVADRYTYLPSVGISIIVAWALRDCASKKSLKAGAGGMVLLILAGLVVATTHNLPRWKNSVALFSDSVQKGSHPAAHMNLGVALADQNNHAAAIEHYTRAIELATTFPEAYYNRALAFQASGDTARAQADYTQAIALNPVDARSFNNRGNLFAAAGQFEPALRDFTQAIALDAVYTDAFANRGRVYLATENYRAAAEDYSKAIATKPDFAAAYHDRAVVFFQLKEYEQAWADVRACRRLGLQPNRELIQRLEAESGKRE